MRELIIENSHKRIFLRESEIYYSKIYVILILINSRQSLYKWPGIDFIQNSPLLQFVTCDICCRIIQLKTIIWLPHFLMKLWESCNFRQQDLHINELNWCFNPNFNGFRALIEDISIRHFRCILDEYSSYVVS